MIRRTIAAAAAACALYAGLAALGAAKASTVSGWWGGEWRCTIDGRPARMRWSPVSNSEVTCEDTDEGEVCSQASTADWAGEFSDNGSAWVPLRNARSGSKGGLYFNHADGNRWYLAQPVGREARGWTTWNGQRYPLSCRH